MTDIENKFILGTGPDSWDVYFPDWSPMPDKPAASTPAQEPRPAGEGRPAPQPRN